jgi:hypothetical protein
MTYSQETRDSKKFALISQELTGFEKCFCAMRDWEIWD